jgi:tryptophan-rich sensory protein
MDTDMDREEMVEKLQDVAKQWAELLRAHGAHEPDWGPLKKVLPLKWCAGFMFMGYSGHVRMYKHGPPGGT